MFVELDEDGSGQARGGDGWESKGPWRPQKIAGLMSQGFMKTIGLP